MYDLIVICSARMHAPFSCQADDATEDAAATEQSAPRYSSDIAPNTSGNNGTDSSMDIDFPDSGHAYAAHSGIDRDPPVAGE